MKKAHILSLSLLPISLLLVSCGQDTPTAISTTSEANSSSSEIENKDRFDMNDRFSGSGANGDGRAEEDDGELELRLDIDDLIADHPYEVHVIVGPEGGSFDPANSDIHVFPVTADEDGELRFKVEFDLGLDPGLYRLDYVVVHDHPTADFPVNLVVACEPASFFTIGGDDDDDDDD